MTKSKSTVKFVAVCFQNFDAITQKLLLSALTDSKYSIELMEEPVDADLCFFNQERESDQPEIETLIELLENHDIPLILLTDYKDLSDKPLLKTLDKPAENHPISEFLNQVQTVFYKELNNTLKRKAAQQPAKLIFNKHLSNAINPEQIQYETNRFYAQKYVGLTPDIDFDVAAELKHIQLNPQSYFFHYLKAAFALSKENQRIARVKTVYGIFYVDALQKVIYHDKNTEEIINIHKIPFYKETQVTIPKFKRAELNALQELYKFDYEPFVWLSSINASKGKVPAHIDFNAPIKLLAWPDLTKLVVFKHSIRIIALWSRGQYSLKQTGQLLKIPQRYPLTIYTAMHALGLIEEAKPQ
ncbi:hypothetical protein [Marinicella litoralis]|uniref:Uncharacterized protein n=1 Tax=Marinicella litoralis TaxID=644220 RepID=A0A4R6XK00_9GAMM|nr:hypothetical protein [Marinicella litoralis]TDR17573.1 hypothetical protein C8D91_2632 [Marinicella litoralis]